LVKDLFTSEPQQLGTLNVWWSWVGWGAKIFNLSTPLAFHLSRILMIPVFMAVAYTFLAYFFVNVIKRKTVLTFLIFASGVGFYFAAPIDALGIEGLTSYLWPIDLWLTEANTFNALYQTSHFIASLVLMLSIFLLMLKAFEKNKFSYVIVSGILGLFYFNFHPYYIPVIYGVLAIYLFMLMLQANRFLWKQSGYLIVLVLISFPSALYHIWLIVQSPTIGFRAIQNVTTISPLPFVIMGYGFLWLGFLLGIYFLIKNKKFNNKHAFLLIWFFVNILLIYSPFPFHSRYTQGLHLILVFFTVSGLFDAFQYLKTKVSDQIFNFWIDNKALWLILFLVMFFPSTLYSVGRDVNIFVNDWDRTFDELFLPEDFIHATNYLSSAEPGLIIAADIPSKFIPGYSGQTVYIAHAHETLFYKAKFPFLIRFYSSLVDDAEKKRFLNSNDIDYVFYSEYEKQLGNFDPASKDYLKLIFDSPEVKIYRVLKD